MSPDRVPVPVAVTAVPVAANAASPPGRWIHGLEWLRAVATLLVVALHAGIAYLLQPMPGLAWPVRDTQPSAVVDVMCWWIDGCAMPLFFLMGGFMACQLCGARGPDAFLQHRARRLLVPFLFGCVVILPLDLYVWLVGWVIEERIPLSKLSTLKVNGPPGEQLWGTSHLWFLQYLFLFCGLSWGVQRWLTGLAGRRDSPLRGFVQRQLQAATISFWSPLLCAIPCAAVLWFQPRVVIGFRHSFWPQAANLAYYLPWYIAGWQLQTLQRSGQEITRWSQERLAVSCVVFSLLIPVIREHVTEELAGLDRGLLVAGFSLFAWLASTGIFGLCLSLRRPAPTVVKYVAEASLWIYLFHHPCVGLAQVSLDAMPLGGAWKCLLVWGAAVSLCLLTYQVAVRSTWLGVLLHGHRDGQRGRPAGAGVETAGDRFRGLGVPGWLLLPSPHESHMAAASGHARIRPEPERKERGTPDAWAVDSTDLRRFEPDLRGGVQPGAGDSIPGQRAA